MKRLLIIASLLALTVGVVDELLTDEHQASLFHEALDLMVPAAEAAPAFETRMNTDGGSAVTFVATIAKAANYCLQCTTATCVKFHIFDGGTQTPVCTSDFVVGSTVYPQPGRVDPEFCFETGVFNRAVGIVFDGGQTQCQLFRDSKNK